MQTFGSVRDAKEFIISRIVSEAEREGIQMSEVEKKMLSFSETGCTLPDIEEVSDIFDREYDEEQFEESIRTVIHRYSKQARKNDPDEFKRWEEAIHMLRKEDHYLLIMLDAQRSTSHWDHNLKLFAVAFGVACVGLLVYLYFVR